MQISIGVDERLHVVEIALDYLREKGYQGIWHGLEIDETHHWPDVAKCVSLDVQSTEPTKEICSAGQGRA